MASIHVLFDGFSKEENDVMIANCSCTLIKTDKCIVIVDTMTAWDKDKILKALSQHKVSPEEVNFVVCTHSHADHIGNNNLFLNAEHIVGLSSNIGEKFYERNIKKDPYILCEEVKVVATPGHTAEDVSVLVDAEENGEQKRYAIVGDLFEREEDITNPTLWQDLGIPELRDTQAKMRWNILKDADFIVPGHGPMFRVTETMKETLKQQVFRGDIPL